MLAASVYDLGLTAAEFSSFTPRHIDRMLNRHRAAEEREDRRIENLMLFYLNVNRSMEKHPEPFTHEEVFQRAKSNGLAAHAEQQMQSLEDFSLKSIEHGARPPIKKWVPNA